MSPREGTASRSGENVSSGQPPVSSGPGDGASVVGGPCPSVRVGGVADDPFPGGSVVHAAATAAATISATAGARSLRIDIGAEP